MMSSQRDLPDRGRPRRDKLALRSVGLLAILLVATSAAGGTDVGGGGGSPPASTTLSVDRFHTPDGQVRDLIQVLLAKNPRIAAAWARSRSGFARVAQARSLPDPQVNYRYFARTPETRVGPQEHALEYVQGVPWGGKRKLHAGRVETLASGATFEAEDLERQLVAALKRFYFEVAYLQEALMVNSEEQALLRRFESIALKRYSTGQGIQQSVIKVQTDISRLSDRNTVLRERLDAVVHRIAELIGTPEKPLELRSIDLSLPDIPPDRDDIEELAVSGHPRVRAVEQRVEADRLWAKSRRLESRPDFRLGFGYSLIDQRNDLTGSANLPDDNGKDVLAFTVGINIPIYRKRIQAGIAEARESQRANQEFRDAIRDQLRFDIQEAFLRLDSLGERSRLYRDVIIPQAEESLASAKAAYTTNKLGFLDLLDAQRILFQSRLVYRRLVSDIWIAVTDIELAAGRRFPIGSGSIS